MYECVGDRQEPTAVDGAAGEFAVDAARLRASSCKEDKGDAHIACYQRPLSQVACAVSFNPCG